jgi:hypothetical protein
MTTKNAVGENNDAHGVRHNDAQGRGLLGENAKTISVTLAGAAASSCREGLRAQR